MRICAIIPARSGSKGIPQKNIIDFAGKPLMAWTIEQAKSSKLISEVYVTSDSKEFLNIASSYGAKPILRPKNISDDKATSESALLHALEVIGDEPDLVVFLQTTSPLRKPDDIDNAINKLIKDEADSLLSLTESQEFMWEEKGNEFSPLTYDINNRVDHRSLRRLYYENGSIYVFKPNVFKMHNNRLCGKQSVYLMESWQRADIDDTQTFDWCLWIFNRNLSSLIG